MPGDPSHCKSAGEPRIELHFMSERFYESINRETMRKRMRSGNLRELREPPFLRGGLSRPRGIEPRRETDSHLLFDACKREFSINLPSAAAACPELG